MHCIKCWNQDTKVVDSRLCDDWDVIRRRRECEICNYRFTTFEKMEIINLVVEKSWDRKERYNRDKLEDSILKAANKRNINMWSINDVVRMLESKWNSKTEISSKQIWKDVLDALMELDEVAYIRYASVHLHFDSAKDFTNLITEKFNGKK